jgi:cation transport regulator ChaB
MPGYDELPSTLQRSGEKAKRTWAEAHDSAVRTYGEGERAHRTAWAALKHTHERVDDRWEPKDRPGPSDPQAARSGAEARRGAAESFGGVDYAGSTRQELYERARRLGVSGRSRMSKAELARAIARAQQNAARSG